jgi:hypothetical protein
MLDNKRGAVTMSGGTIFGLTPFVPKRQLVLPSKGGEITLYVLEGKAYPSTIQEIGMPPRKEIAVVHFGGWMPGFKNTKLNIPMEHLVEPGDFEHYTLDVIFRLVPSDKYGQTAEIVAISYDDCKTFHENEYSTLVSEYETV